MFAGEFASYNIDSPHVLNALKKQVTLARNIIKMNSKLKSVTDNANWIERCAKEMDLLLDEDDLYPLLQRYIYTYISRNAFNTHTHNISLYRYQISSRIL